MGTYKTNWQLTETVMPEDMNRIEENTKENNNALSEFKKQYNADSKEENKKIDRKAEKEDVILKVPYPEDRDCNSFKTLNAFCAFDTGLGDFKNTPEGTLIQGSARVFLLKNIGYNLGRFQQEFINLYPEDRITKYTRNYIYETNSWGNWYKNYDSVNKPTLDELGTYSKEIIDIRTKILDTRNDNQNPNWYIQTYPYQVVNEFKISRAIGIPNGGALFGVLETKIPWNNTSGGFPVQTFKSNSYPTYKRHGISDTEWSEWVKVYDENNRPTYREVGAIPKQTPRIKEGSLNDVVEAGFYAVQASTVTDIPVKRDGRMIVASWDWGSWSSQLYFPDGGEIYHRMSLSQDGTTWTDWTQVYTKASKPTPDEIGASGKSLCLDNRQSFVVNGDANKYYPVIIKAGDMNAIGVYGLVKLSISRGYASKAPDSWNNQTHKGGLTLTLLTTGDVYWGGNDPNIEVLRFDQTYSKIVAGMKLSTRGIVVWLRGGGAKYYLTSDYGISSNATVMLDGFTDAAQQTFEVRSDDSLVDSEIRSKYQLRTSGLYDNGARVYSSKNKPSLSDLGAAASNHNHDSAYLGKTATAVNSNRLANIGLYDSSTGTQGIPNVGNDGVMEVGRMIDFHEAGTNKDFNTRLESINGALKCWQDFSAISLWAQKYLRINDWYGGSEDGRFYYKQEGKQLRTENIETLYVNGSAVAKGDYWDVGESTRVFNLGGGLRLVRQWIGTNASNSAGGVSYTIHFPKAWSWVIPISLVSDNMANTNSYTSGYCTIDALSNVHLNGGCYQMTPGKSTRIHLTYLAGE